MIFSDFEVRNLRPNAEGGQTRLIQLSSKLVLYNDYDGRRNMLMRR